jgi:hypothetical protein
MSLGRKGFRLRDVLGPFSRAGVTVREWFRRPVPPRPTDQPSQTHAVNQRPDFEIGGTKRRPR